jgi:hypothetical protein
MPQSLALRMDRHSVVGTASGSDATRLPSASRGNPRSDREIVTRNHNLSRFRRDAFPQRDLERSWTRVNSPTNSVVDPLRELDALLFSRRRHEGMRSCIVRAVLDIGGVRRSGRDNTIPLVVDGVTEPTGPDRAAQGGGRTKDRLADHRRARARRPARRATMLDELPRPPATIDIEALCLHRAKNREAGCRCLSRR